MTRAAGANRRVVLLRGVNVGAANRLAMPALREALSAAGFGDVRTHVQSGNVVLDSELDDDTLAQEIRRLIAARFALDPPVVVRTAEELAAVVAGNPFPQAAELGPKQFQVTFFSAPLEGHVAARVAGLTDGAFQPGVESIALAPSRRSAYGWHPHGIHKSKLARELSDEKLGVTATARNWTTVMTLLQMTTADDA